MTLFQTYWKKLKETRPKEYQDRLKRNRDRLRNIRVKIKEDPEKYESYKARQRELYHRKKTTF